MGKSRKELSVDVYFGKADYTVYGYDGQKCTMHRERTYEENVCSSQFTEEEDRRIFALLEKYYQPVLQSFYQA